MYNHVRTFACGVLVGGSFMAALNFGGMFWGFVVFSVGWTAYIFSEIRRRRLA